MDSKKWNVNKMKLPSASVEEYIEQDWCFEESRDWNAIEIASVVRKWANSGDWLDLGCGPMLSVWPMFAENATNIFGCDRQFAISDFHRKLKSCPSEEWPAGLLNAVKFYNRNFLKNGEKERIVTPIDRIQELVIKSILEVQPCWKNRFETVIQIGCFGCLNSIEDLKIALNHVHYYLKHDGVFISATWLPRHEYEESDVWGGVGLGTLSCEKFVSLIREVSMKDVEVRLTRVNDPFHEIRYVIIAKKI